MVIGESYSSRVERYAYNVLIRVRVPVGSTLNFLALCSDLTRPEKKSEVSEFTNIVFCEPASAALDIQNRNNMIFCIDCISWFRKVSYSLHKYSGFDCVCETAECTGHYKVWNTLILCVPLDVRGPKRTHQSLWTQVCHTCSIHVNLKLAERYHPRHNIFFYSWDQLCNSSAL